MRTMVRTADPFAMLVDPEGFFGEIEKSERLKAMHGRICRPLDRVVTPKAPGHESVVDEGDQSVLGDDLE